MRRWLGWGLLVWLMVLSGMLWGAWRSFDLAAAGAAFARLPDHDYVADIEALQQQDKLAEALALSRFVCAQADYPQRLQACERARTLDMRLRSFWYRLRSVGSGALTGVAENGWGLAGATAADFLLVGDVRDLAIQSWRLSSGQDADELLLALSAVGLLTVTVPGFDWLPSFGKMAVRLGAFSRRFSRQLLHLSRQAVARRTLTALRQPFDNLRQTVVHLGPVRTLGILPIIDEADELATVARAAAKHPNQTYGLLKVGGRPVLAVLAAGGPEATADLLRVARKGAPGVHLFQRVGSRLFTSHLLVGAGKALHRGRLPHAMSLWLAAQPPLLRGLVTTGLAVAWLATAALLWRVWRRGQRAAAG